LLTCSAAIHSGKAERLARALLDSDEKSSALVRVAVQLVGVDPDQAVRIARSIPDGSRASHTPAHIAKEAAPAAMERSSFTGRFRAVDHAPCPGAP
jgi:hypothetical protein